jgi:hypothetical protein
MFTKGNSIATGRPNGAKSVKPIFNVKDCLNKRFPARLARLQENARETEQAISCPGKKNMIAYLNGQKLTARQTLIANCFDCCGNYADGRKDCENPLCVCYPFMPYRLKGHLQPVGTVDAHGNTAVVG